MLLTIPQVRDELRELVGLLRGNGNREYVAGEIETLLPHMYRRKPHKERVMGVRPKAPLAAIRAYYAAHPDLDHVDIGNHFEVAVSRVSRALAGRRQDG